MIQLKNDTTVTIGREDMCRILTKAFCGEYTPFGGSYVESIEQGSDGDFTALFSVKEVEAE